MYKYARHSESRTYGGFLAQGGEGKVSGHDVFGTLAALGSLPVDVLGGNLDIAGLAVNTAEESQVSSCLARSNGTNG